VGTDKKLHVAGLKEGPSRKEAKKKENASGEPDQKQERRKNQERRGTHVNTEDEHNINLPETFRRNVT